MKIDKQVAKEITDKIKGFVQTLQDQYGVVVEKTGGTFSDAELNLRLTMRVMETKREAGVKTPAEAQYDLYMLTHKLPPRGTVLIDAYGERWTPIEWIPKGRKFNVLAIKGSDGRRYKFEARAISLMSRE